MTQHFMKVRVMTVWIDAFPELLEAYKRSMDQSMLDLYSREADWTTFRRFDYADEPLSREDDKPYSLLMVESK